MSGGRFDYKQYHINEIADSIERVLKGEPWVDEEFCVDLSTQEAVRNKMKEAVKALRIAAIYAHRVDYLISGDDGEESFLTRLEDDLKELHKTN